MSSQHAASAPTTLDSHQMSHAVRGGDTERSLVRPGEHGPGQASVNPAGRCIQKHFLICIIILFSSGIKISRTFLPYIIFF